MKSPTATGSGGQARNRYVPAVGPGLRKLLYLVFGLFALLSANSVYLTAVTLAEWLTGETYQNLTYQYLFLLHLALGLLVLLPVLVFGGIHIHNAHTRPNRRAIKAGFALFTIALILLFSGLLLTRGLPLLEVKHPDTREVLYWAHVIAPLLIIWLFVMHRLAGKKIRWEFGFAIGAGALLLAGLTLLGMMQDPRDWGRVGPASGEQYFLPSLARTASGQFIPPERLMTDDYCAECHADIHGQWSVSAHRLASFNNPAYLFSVRNTRRKMIERDGDLHGARLCAGCHDPVPFFSGAFNQPDFDDVNDPTAQAGITCTGCHAITHINSLKGNADYTIEEPLYYPFTFSDNPLLSWINRTLVKAKPAFHNKTFLKPLHRSPEFCGACHKVHLPKALNNYRWLRVQNHYDSYHLSGTSGHGVASFYYPPKAEHNCNGCHMELIESHDFGAREGPSGQLSVHDHQFPSANTAIPYLLGLSQAALDRHHEFARDTLRVDLFALRREGAIDGELIGPLRPSLPTLERGATYLLEVVVRTLKLGHMFTQGTADSNEVWLDLKISQNGRLIGRSGAMDASLEVDTWSHFINAYVIDRDGRRIDRRNPEDIFTVLYNHQIPPGAADIVHYRFTVPEQAVGPLQISAELKYRKFDARFMSFVRDDPESVNDLPIIALADDRLELPLSASLPEVDSTIPEWERWNDYGIGLLRKPGNGQLRQAEQAFVAVAELGRSEGLLNLARVYLREGRLREANEVLAKAVAHPELNYPWTATWLSAQVDQQNGYLDQAIRGLKELLETRYQLAREREFDFSQDYRLQEQLAQVLFERSRLERGEIRAAERVKFLEASRDGYLTALALEPERASAHYGLAQAYAALGAADQAEQERELHRYYKVDDNARDSAIVRARAASAAASHAADPVVIYDLQRAAGPGLEAGGD
jgi:hypothetical protein